MRILNLLLLFCLSIATRAQERLVTISDRWSDQLSSRYSLIPLEEQDAFVLTYPGQHGIQRVLKQNGYPPLAILQQVDDTAYQLAGYRRTVPTDPALIRLYNNYQTIGGVYRNKVLLEAIQQNRRKAIYLVRTDLQSGNSTLQDTIPYEHPEDLLSCVAYAGGLKLLLSIKGSSQLRIYTATPGADLHYTIIDVPFRIAPSASAGLRTGDVEQVSDLFYPRRFETFIGQLPYPALAARSRIKLFEQPGRLVILVADSDARTHALILDLATDTLSYRSFTQVGNDRHGSGTNAFLVDTILITARTDRSALNIEYFHLLDGRKLGEQVIDASTAASQTIDGIEKRGDFWKKTDVKSSDMSQFLSYASDNRLSLSAWRQDNDLIVDVAAPYKDVVGANILASVLVSAAGTYAINSSSNTRGALFASFPQAEALTYIGFQTAVSDGRFEARRIRPLRTFWQRWMSHLKPGQQVLAFMNGYFYVGQTIDEDRRIVISRFGAESTPGR